MPTGPADPSLPGSLVRFRTAVAHRPVRIGVPLLAVALIASFAVEPGPGSSASTAADVVQGTAQVMFIGLQIFSLAHNRRMCLRCLSDAPLDPQRAVDAARGRLRWFHHVLSTAGLGLVIGAPIVLLVAGALLHPVFGVLAMTPFLPLAALSLTHHRLEPWCPYCRWDDGDDDGGDDTEPDSDPLGRVAPTRCIGPAPFAD